MVTNISHITLLVHNQEEAARFYTEKLGFVITESHKGEDGTYFWLTIAPSMESTSIFTLMLPVTQEDKALVGKQTGSVPFCILTTNDCHKTAAEFAARGVTFIKQPTAEFWGIDALIKDLYGNIIDLCQVTDH